MGSRAISIKTSEGIIETPTRSLSASELMKLKGIRNESEIPASPFDVADEPFPWQIYEGTIKYDRNTVDNMLNSSNGLSDKKSTINSKISPVNSLLGEGESKKLLKMIYPKVKADDTYTVQEIGMLAEIQYESNVDIIVLPEIKAGCKADQFKNSIKEVSKLLDNLGNKKPIMPVVHINCGYHEFENKINYIYDSGFGMAGIICHTYHVKAGLHVLRGKIRELENFWIHGFGAWRTRRNSQLYNPHAAQVWGIDSVGIGAQGGGRKKKDNDTQEAISQNEILRGYNSEDWGMHRVNPTGIEDVLCDCEGCKHYHSSLKIKQNALDVHEALKSHEQSVIARERIIEGSYKDFIKGKKQIKDYYENEIGDINQSRLNGF
ncbi:MAG: hypothetical protein NKF70_11115 [Methanobacterium sp. ERen5]|nr:MAG: hypothetical protein NKF70_11115 [Methanobacterium sp. ERen5]